MAKVIDLDKVFDERLKKFISKNAGKFTESEWEEQVNMQYLEFITTTLDSLGDSPQNYYQNLDAKAAVELLVLHINSNVSVPDILCKSIEQKQSYKYLAALIDNSNEQIASYAISLIANTEPSNAANQLFDVLIDQSKSQNLREMALDALSGCCQMVKERALQCAQEPSLIEYMLEILINCPHDDRILHLILTELDKNDNKIAQFAHYAATYGDERALDKLLKLIDMPQIDYIDYQELKCAIETLGGEYTKARDFTNDYIFKKIKEIDNLN